MWRYVICFDVFFQLRVYFMKVSNGGLFVRCEMTVSEGSLLNCNRANTESTMKSFTA